MGRLERRSQERLGKQKEYGLMEEEQKTEEGRTRNGMNRTTTAEDVGETEKYSLEEEQKQIKEGRRTKLDDSND